MNEKSKRLMALFESLGERSKDILLLQAETVREAQEAFKVDYGLDRESPRQTREPTRQAAQYGLSLESSPADKPQDAA